MKSLTDTSIPDLFLGLLPPDKRSPSYELRPNYMLCPRGATLFFACGPDSDIKDPQQILDAVTAHIEEMKLRGDARMVEQCNEVLHVLDTHKEHALDFARWCVAHSDLPEEEQEVCAAMDEIRSEQYNSPLSKQIERLRKLGYSGPEPETQLEVSARIRCLERAQQAKRRVDSLRKQSTKERRGRAQRLLDALPVADRGQR